MKRRLILLLLALAGSSALIGCSPFSAPPAPQGDQLIFADDANSSLSQLDLATQETQPIFEVPQNSWVNQIDLAADGRTLALSFTPPPPKGSTAFFDRAGLYTLALDEPDGPLNPLLIPDEAEIFYFNPVWTPDGRYLFTVRFSPNPANDSRFDVALLRFEPATGELRHIADDGIWPRVSPDGQRLTYITVDPESLQRGLVVTDLAGGQAVELVPIGAYFDIDSPLFSGDSQWVYFTVSPEESQSRRSWWEWLAGVQVALAHTDHNVPSDWWRIPTDGGTAEKLTDEGAIIIFGTFDPSGELLYYSTTEGLFTVTADGRTINQIGDAPSSRTLAVRSIEAGQGSTE